MALWTNVGRNLVASAVQAAGANCAIAYVGISKGCGTLASALTAGNTYVTLTLDAALPVAIPSLQSLTITDGTNSQVVTASAPVTAGATSIPVTSFVALFSFAAHTSGLAPTPSASDLALYNESARVAILASAAGGSAGESLTQGYMDGTQPTGVYLMVGFFGGATATSSVGTGTLMGEDVRFWNHTVNADSFMYQADSTV